MKRRRKLQKDLANQRIQILFTLAFKNYKKNKEFARNCIRIAFNIKKKFNLKFPKKYKNVYCRKCFSLLIPPENCRIRIEGKGRKIKIIKTCLNCKKIIREEIRKE